MNTYHAGIHHSMFSAMQKFSFNLLSNVVSHLESFKYLQSLKQWKDVKCWPFLLKCFFQYYCFKISLNISSPLMLALEFGRTILQMHHSFILIPIKASKLDRSMKDCSTQDQWHYSAHLKGNLFLGFHGFKCSIINPHLPGTFPMLYLTVRVSKTDRCIKLQTASIRTANSQQPGWIFENLHKQSTISGCITTFEAQSCAINLQNGTY